MSDYKRYFAERYQRMLLERDFDVTKEALDGIEDWKNVETSADTLSSLEDVSDDGVETLEVIDKDAWTEDDLQDSYEGKVILECVACHSRITVDQADVYEDEETQTACPDIMCPVCHSELGYTILGKIEKFNAPDEEEEEEKIDFPEEEDEEDMNADWAERDSMGNGDLLPGDEDSEGEDEEEVHESLKTRLQRRRLGESKELDEKLPRELSRNKGYLQTRFGKDIDFENSTFDEISPEELAGMSRADRRNVLLKKNQWSYEPSIVGERGARAGKIIDRDWGEKNTNIDVSDPADVRKYIKDNGKIYKVGAVDKDVDKLASRVGNSYIRKANDARKNARSSFQNASDFNSKSGEWDDSTRRMKWAQNDRNKAAELMNKRFDDPITRDYRKTKGDIESTKMWKKWADDEVENNADEVRSAELASQYGTRYASDVVDNERRAREYQAYADDARKKGLEYAKNMDDEERERIANKLSHAKDRLNKSKETSAEYQRDIDKSMADFKARHNKRMGKSESLNEAPEGYDYNNLYTQDEKSRLDSERLFDELRDAYNKLLTRYTPRLQKLQNAIEQSYAKTKFDWDRFAPQRDSYLFCIASQEADEGTYVSITGGDNYDDPINLIIDVATPDDGTFSGFIDSTGYIDDDYDLDDDDDVVYVIDQLRLLASDKTAFENAFKEAYNNLDACIKLAGFEFDESLKEGADCEDCDESCKEELEEGKDCEDCENLEECGDQLKEAGNLHITDQKDMKRLGSKNWYSADNEKYFDAISKNNDIYVNPKKKTGAARNKETGRTYKFDKDNKPITDESLTEAVNNLSLDTDDTHLEMTADENGRISVVSEPTNAPMEEVPDTAVQGEDSIVPLDMGDMAEVEDNISPDEQNEIMDAESEEPEVPAAEETEGSEGAEEPFESEEEFEVEAESFNYLGNTFAKKLYENVQSYKMTSSGEINGKLVVEGVIKFNSGNSKKTRFVFDEAKETRTGRIVLEGINPTFYNGKAFKLKGKLNNGKLFCESLKYNYSIDNLNESTGKTEPIAIRGIVRSK